MALLIADRFADNSDRINHAEILRALKHGLKDNTFLFTSSQRGGQYFKFDMAVRTIDGNGFKDIK